VVEVIGGLDLRSMTGSYRGSGEASYHPELLLGLIVYGYATGVFSSRKLERASYDSVAFRFIAANEHPDHDTIAAFRRRFLKQIETLFVQVLSVAGEMGVLKLGTVALDGTKIHANASRHSALSYEHAGKIEAQLQAEVAELMAKAEAADQADVPDGMSIPEELARREARLAAIARAKATIEARAKERHARERADYEAELKAREDKTAATGKKPAGRPPTAPVEGPLRIDQVNLTDEESRMMPVAGGGFEQCYNAQAAVAVGSLLVIVADVVQAPNDKQQLCKITRGQRAEVRQILAPKKHSAECQMQSLPMPNGIRKIKTPMACNETPVRDCPVFTLFGFITSGTESPSDHTAEVPRRGAGQAGRTRGPGFPNQHVDRRTASSGRGVGPGAGGAQRRGDQGPAVRPVGRRGRSAVGGGAAQEVGRQHARRHGSLAGRPASGEQPRAG
jgi:transposase